MIKFEEWYDGLQTKIMACSSEETKENNNVECYYSVGNYIKKEIEYMQQTIDKQKEVLDKIKEIMNEDDKADNIYMKLRDYLEEIE